MIYLTTYLSEWLWTNARSLNAPRTNPPAGMPNALNRVPTATSIPNPLQRGFAYQRPVSNRTATPTSHATNDRGEGWRWVVHYALTENPVMTHADIEARIPEFFARTAGPMFDGLRWDDVEKATSDQ
jgi:hypothetical protein